MKKKSLLFLLVAFVILGPVHGQQDKKVENAVAFANLYGYVRYFHPSDEAAAVDWDRFAVYGSQQVAGCKTPEELKSVLSSLFHPIAPTVQIYLENEDGKFNTKDLMPANPKKYSTIAWQHVGLGLDDARSAYKSARTNRPLLQKVSTPMFGSEAKSIDASKYIGKEFVLKGKVKLASGTGTGHLWVRIDKAGKAMGFFDNMGDRPIKSNTWAYYEIKGKVDQGADKINVGAFLSGAGELQVDDLSLTVNENGKWEEVFSSSFSDQTAGKAPTSIGYGVSGSASSGNPNYQFVVSQEKEEKWLAIKSVDSQQKVKELKHPLLFKAVPQVGEYTSKAIGGGLKAVVPLALYGTKEQTYPAADKGATEQLQTALKNIPAAELSGDNLYSRLGSITIAWNVFQHFYPYFDVVKTDWRQDLHQALSRAYTDKTASDHLKNLQTLTAKLQDGHVFVNFMGNQATHQPPITWEWVEDKLVVTNVLAPAVPLSKGDIVTSIDGKSPEGYFANVHQHISAATKGYMAHRAQTESLLGPKGSVLQLTVTKADNSTLSLALERTFTRRQALNHLPKADSIKSLADGIMYINLDVTPMVAIEKALPQLQQSKTIICDLRGYPRGNHGLIEYLLPVKDTSSQWMQIPRFIYPDQEKVVGYQKENWFLKPKSPHLTANVIFLIDGRAISYAESYMSLIENYKLATIVGQPTAGTNGNINPFPLPGGYTISWTGMKVLKHDGSQHHGVGIIPNVYVEKSIKGVRENLDEFLEKAMELAKAL